MGFRALVVFNGGIAASPWSVVYDNDVPVEARTLIESCGDDVASLAAYSRWSNGGRTEVNADTVGWTEAASRSYVVPAGWELDGSASNSHSIALFLRMVGTVPQLDRQSEMFYLQKLHAAVSERLVQLDAQMEGSE